MKFKATYGKLFILLVVIFVFAGCGSGKEAIAEGETDHAWSLEGVATFNVIMNDSFFGYSDSNISNPPVWTVPAGVEMIFNFDNVGQMKHDWAIVKQGATISIPFDREENEDIILYGGGIIHGESKSTVRLNAPEPGAYQIICTISGHYPFMQGKFVVTE